MCDTRQAASAEAAASSLVAVQVSMAGGGVRLIGQGSQAAVTQADVAVCNGVVHVIDTLLIPAVAAQEGGVAAAPSAMMAGGGVAAAPSAAMGTTGTGGAGLVGAAAPATAVAGA
jgi:transforming growth factor-beta-induced protein